MTYAPINQHYTNRAARRFTPPATLEDGERQRLELVASLDDVNGQLTERDGARDANGNYLEDAATLFEWRRRAVVAKRTIEGKLRFLNQWLKEQRRARTADQARDLGFDSGDPISLLLAAATTLRRFKSDGVEFDPDENAVLYAISDFLQHGPVTP